MLKQASSVLRRFAPSVVQAGQEASEALVQRGFATLALQGSELVSSATSSAVGGVQGALTNPAASASPSSNSLPQPSLPAQLSASRSMGYAYARHPEGKNYVATEHAHAFGQGMLTDYLIKVVPKFIKFGVVGPAQSSFLYQEPTLYTTPEHLTPLMLFLRDHMNTQFKCLLDVTAVDFPERAARFEVVYHLLSPRWNNRIRIKVPVDELTPVPSVSHIFKTANWFERETWDMYGVFFTGHPDLRRILTDYGFTGHPLRKVRARPSDILAARPLRAEACSASMQAKTPSLTTATACWRGVCSHTACERPPPPTEQGLGMAVVIRARGWCMSCCLLWLPAVAAGLPAHRLQRGAVRLRQEARGLGAAGADAGVQVRAWLAAWLRACLHTKRPPTQRIAKKKVLGAVLLQRTAGRGAGAPLPAPCCRAAACRSFQSRQQHCLTTMFREHATAANARGRSYPRGQGTAQRQKGS